MEYKLENIHINGDSEKIEFPPLKDRIIEKRGHVITFSLSDIEESTLSLLKSRKEVEAKLNYEKVIVDNIEQHHAFVKDMSDQDLLTVWMYKQSKGHVDLATAKLAEIDKQLEDYKVEVAEILEQIPELKESEPVKSAEIVDGEVKLSE